MESCRNSVHRGEILGFEGSWASGMAMLLVNRIVDIGPDLKPVYERDNVPCDNGPTVRALAAAYPHVIGPGHTVNLDAIIGEEIEYTLDGIMGMLAGFSPVEEVEDEPGR